jgi:hypothetical protein
MDSFTGMRRYSKSAPSVRRGVRRCACKSRCRCEPLRFMRHRRSRALCRTRRVRAWCVMSIMTVYSRLPAFGAVCFRTIPDLHYGSVLLHYYLKRIAEIRDTVRNCIEDLNILRTCFDWFCSCTDTGRQTAMIDKRIDKIGLP